MLTICSPCDLRNHCDHIRNGGKKIGVVPTMGYLHEGHLSLMRFAKQCADEVVVSIFVNPTQFGPNEDFAHYPRDLKSDLAKCVSEGVSVVFLPEVHDMYPSGAQTFVEVTELSSGLCGASRPGHFKGVATIVAKLFNIIGPCKAIFGEKDYQQLQVIHRMAHDLHFPVEVIGRPIVREQDGLAMSSRNAYLSADERKQATCLFRALSSLRDIVHAGQKHSAREAIGHIESCIRREKDARIDYIEVRNAITLEPEETIGQGNVFVALAVFIGKTRLIDNMIF